MDPAPFERHLLLAHWGPLTCEEKTAVRKRLKFWFSGFLAAVLELVMLKPGELVQWHVVDGGAENWRGIDVEFKILRVEDKTLVCFQHSKWHEKIKSFSHCSLGWAIFLISLKKVVETGKGRPHPYDISISLWAPSEEGAA